MFIVFKTCYPNKIIYVSNVYEDAVKVFESTQLDFDQSKKLIEIKQDTLMNVDLNEIPYILHVRWKDTVKECFTVEIDGIKVYQTFSLDDAERRFFDCSHEKHKRHRRELNSNTRYSTYAIEFLVFNK